MLGINNTNVTSLSGPESLVATIEILSDLVTRLDNTSSDILSLVTNGRTTVRVLVHMNACLCECV